MWMKKTTHVERQYENKVFLIGQIRRFALKLSRHCNISPSHFLIYLNQTEDGFETSTISTIDDLLNIREINGLAFYSSSGVIRFDKSYSNSLNIRFSINGGIEIVNQIILLTENTLELTRLSEKGTGKLTVDNSQPIEQIQMDSNLSGKGANQCDEAINKRQLLEIDEPLFELMMKVYVRESENSVGSFEDYYRKVIRLHCLKQMVYDQ